MPEDFLGDGLVLEDVRHVDFVPGQLAEGAELARLNADNLQLLIAEASMEEARANEALKEESPALLHELQRLEYKLNILLRLTAELTMRQQAMPPLQRIRLAAHGMELYGEAPAVGVGGLAKLYINPAVPQPLLLPCVAVGEFTRDAQRGVRLQFAGVSAPVAEALEKLIFRHHRRLIAGTRQVGGRN
jgi:hypothetical protein